MSKGKPRHNPDKPANKYGDRCPYYEEYITGKVGCECKSFYGDELECKGNRHNCVKVTPLTSSPGVGWGLGLVLSSSMRQEV